MMQSAKQTLKYTIFSIGFLFIFSCKSNKAITNGSVNENLSAKAIIKTHYQNHINFKTLSGKLKINYSDGESSQGVSVSIRIEKDKAIWMSAPLGMVKVYITPNRVSFYNKLQNEFFDGNFSYLSNLLGTELNFDKVQNLLLGQAIFDLRKEKYTTSIVNKNYQLKPRKAADLFKTLFTIEATNFKISTQQIAQPLKKRVLEIDYKNYQEIQNKVLPNTIVITAIDKDKTNTIDLEYRNMEFNRTLNFPYKIPKGFDEIVLENNDK